MPTKIVNNFDDARILAKKQANAVNIIFSYLKAEFPGQLSPFYFFKNNATVSMIKTTVNHTIATVSLCSFSPLLRASSAFTAS
jgi:hypothetical protein